MRSIMIFAVIMVVLGTVMAQIADRMTASPLPAAHAASAASSSVTRQTLVHVACHDEARDRHPDDRRDRDP